MVEQEEKSRSRVDITSVRAKVLVDQVECHEVLINELKVELWDT